MGGNLPALRCTADPCVDWIRAGTFINPEYHRIRVHDPAAAAAQMNLLQSQLVGVDGASIIELPWDSAETEHAAAVARSDITRPDNLNGVATTVIPGDNMLQVPALPASALAEVDTSGGYHD